MHYRAHIGKEAEELVAQKLIENGFTILERNYRKRHGEIDLIASKYQLLVFVEVKMRHHRYFDLSDVITPSKQRKIIATAKDYLMRKGGSEDRSYRFDVALLEGAEHSLELTYIPNAFNESDCAW